MAYSPYTPSSKNDWQNTDYIKPQQMNDIGDDIRAINNNTSELNTAVGGKANSSHTHSTSNITSGVLGVARGGTGLSSIGAHKMLYTSANNTLAATNAGTNDYVLVANNSGDPNWEAKAPKAIAADTAATLSATLAVNKGGTGATTLAANRLLLGNGTSALTSLASGSDGQYLKSNGTAPSWATPTSIKANLASTDAQNALTGNIGVTGTLPVSNGGTGVSSLASDAYALLGCTSGGGVTTHNIFNWENILGIKSPADTDTIDFNDLSAYGTSHKALFLDTRDISKYTHAPVNSSFAKGWIFEFNGINDRTNSKTQILITICKTNSDMRACQVFVRTYDASTWIPNDADGYHDANGWKKLNFATSAW